MFTEITMINYTRPPAERAKARKFCGPYKWRPSQPGKGRGFYQSSQYLEMDGPGSSFALRLDYANTHAPGYSYSRPTGYFCDQHGDDKLTPIIARLPRGRGFLAGWTMGRGMCAALAPDIYHDIEDAALAAYNEAENDAERMRGETELGVEQ